jgi:hypothetical protein
MSKIIQTILSKNYISDLSPKLAEGLGKKVKSRNPLINPLINLGEKKAYFEHYTSHIEPSAVQSSFSTYEDYIIDSNYYLSMATNNSAYYADKNFHNIQDHWKKLFKIPFDINVGEDKDEQISNSIIFPGVRHIESNMIIFEMPPAYRHVSYQHAYRDNASGTSYRKYYIPVPWQVYVATFSNDMRLVDVQMYFSKTSLYSMDQKLYSPPLLNFYGSGLLCRPFFESLEDVEKYPKTISGIISSAFDWVWNTGFNWDITEPISQYLHSRFYESMQPFVDRKTYESLVPYFHGSAPHTNAQVHSVDAMFTLWQNVPLENVLDLDWIAFCIYSDFYYQSIELYLSNHFSQDFNQYIEDNNIDLIPEDEVEDEEQAESREHDIQSILQSTQFHSFMAPKLNNFNSTLKHAYDIADRRLHSYRLKPTNNYSFFTKKSYQTDAFVKHLDAKILEITSSV